MPILAEGSLVNIHGTIDRYVTEHLVVAAGLSVRLHGVRRFVPPTDAPWVEVHYDFLGLQSAYRRQTGRWADDALIQATERQGNLQLDIYQRARFWATRYTTAVARDAVMGVFPEGKVLQIYSAGGSGEPVGALIFDGCYEHVQDHGMQSGLTQHVIQVGTRYLEHYTL